MDTDSRSSWPKNVEKENFKGTKPYNFCSETLLRFLTPVTSVLIIICKESSLNAPMHTFFYGMQIFF